VGTSWESSSPESRTDFETLGRWDRKHGMGEDCFEFIETWFTETEGTVSNDTGDGTSERVVGCFSCPDRLQVSLELTNVTVDKMKTHISHLGRSLFVRTSGQFLINLIPRNILDELQQFFSNDILPIIKW
jgi:hypothetical protein